MSNFQYGLDNWIWAMQGYNDSYPRRRRSQLFQLQPGLFPFPPGDAGHRIPPLHEQQHVGARASPRKGSSSVRRPTAIRASLCPSPIATTSRLRGGGRRSCSARSPTRTSSERLRTRSGKSTNMVGTRPPQVMRFTRRERIPASTGTARLSSPNRPVTWWGRLSFDPTAQGFARRTRSTCLPATTNGPRRSWPRWGRTARVGRRLVQLHRAAQSHAARF